MNYLAKKTATALAGAILLSGASWTWAQNDECAKAENDINALKCAFGASPTLPSPLTHGLLYISESDLSATPHETFLYPDSSNKIPTAHQAAGDSIALTVVPLNIDGEVDFELGRIKIIAEGMSNARDEFNAFRTLFIENNIDLREEVEFVNLSEGGCDLLCWVDRGVEEIDRQVQIAFLKHSNNRPQNPDGSPKSSAPPFSSRDDKRFPSHALTTKEMLKTRILDLKSQYPNLKMVFLTSRSFGGWSCVPENGSYREPVGFEEGFSVKWLIEDQISGADAELRLDGDSPTPWLAWGPYIWNPETPEDYFKGDGVHPCDSGTAYISNLWYEALLANTAARPWLLKNPLTPVELASFTAEVVGFDVHLRWTTASETNNLGFEIQRLRLGVEAGMNSWKIAGFVEGRGTSSSQYDYQFRDLKLASGEYEYRLKQIDFDGAFEYSANLHVVVSGPSRFELLQNYPNPFRNQTEIVFRLETAETATLEIVNLLGQTVRTFDLRPTVGEVQKIIWNGLDDAGTPLPPGLYFYRIGTGARAISNKLILTR